MLSTASEPLIDKPIERPIKLAGIVGDSITDGPGIRLTVFVQGCPHRCPGCHNPQTWDFEGGCEATPAEIMAQIAANPLLSGVTFSGGEPFCQAAALLPLAREIGARGLELAIYTGYTFEQLLELKEPAVRELLGLADNLIDGPYLQARRNLELNFRGSENQRILKARESLAAGRPILEEADRWY